VLWNVNDVVFVVLVPTASVVVAVVRSVNARVVVDVAGYDPAVGTQVSCVESVLVVVSVSVAIPPVAFVTTVVNPCDDAADSDVLAVVYVPARFVNESATFDGYPAVRSAVAVACHACSVALASDTGTRLTGAASVVDGA